MRLFLYGTLADPATLAARSGDARLPARARAATLPGFRRVQMRGARWPTLALAQGEAVPGLLLSGLPAPALARLAAWEGPRYRLRPFRPRDAATGRPCLALAWIAPGACPRQSWPGAAR